MGALAGAAARLCARARLFHLPPLGERRLVHRLQAESFPLALVESLEKKEKKMKKKKKSDFLQKFKTEHLSDVAYSSGSQPLVCVPVPGRTERIINFR